MTTAELPAWLKAFIEQEPEYKSVGFLPHLEIRWKTFENPLQLGAATTEAIYLSEAKWPDRNLNFDDQKLLLVFLHEYHHSAELWDRRKGCNPLSWFNKRRSNEEMDEEAHHEDDQILERALLFRANWNA